MNTYEELNEYLTQGRKPDRRFIYGIKTTYVVRLDNHRIAIQFNNINCVIHHMDGTQQFTTDGTWSVGMKSRINNYGRGVKVSIHRRHGSWYLKWNGETYMFEDLMKIHPDGTITWEDGTRMKPITGSVP